MCENNDTSRELDKGEQKIMEAYQIIKGMKGVSYSFDEYKKYYLQKSAEIRNSQEIIRSQDNSVFDPSMQTSIINSLLIRDD